MKRSSNGWIATIRRFRFSTTFLKINQSINQVFLRMLECDYEPQVAFVKTIDEDIDWGTTDVSMIIRVMTAFMKMPYIPSEGLLQKCESKRFIRRLSKSTTDEMVVILTSLTRNGRRPQGTFWRSYIVSLMARLSAATTSGTTTASPSSSRDR